MAQLLIVILSFTLCQLLGRYSESLLLFALLTLVQQFRKKPSKIAVLGFVSTISYAIMTAQNACEWALFPAAVIWVTRCCLAEDKDKGHFLICIFSLFSAAYLSFLADRDWIALSLSVCATTAPAYSKSICYTFLNKKIETVGCWLLLFVIPFTLIVCLYPACNGKSAVVAAGVWAKLDKKMAECPLDQLDMSTMYSYAELRELLGAEITTWSQLDNTIQEAWAIIPTCPLTDSEKTHVLDWVSRGGRLLLITDHTDLFGHASVLNDVLKKLGIACRTDAFFPVEDPSQSADVSLHSNLPLKTANTHTGWLLWPTTTARWVSEPVDYSNRNFFGPMRATGNAEYGRRVITGVRSYNKGQIILFGDSTIFANFAIYQPGIIPFLEHLRAPKVMPILLGYVLGISILGLVLAAICKQVTLLLYLPLIGFWSCLDIRTLPITWPDHVCVYGDASAVSEWTDPNNSFSTVYSVIPITGLKPRWTSTPSAKTNGIWIGNTPPANEHWDWLSTDRAYNTDLHPIEKQLETLLDQLNEDKPLEWSSVNKTENKVLAGGVWTNDALGEWWIDHGISTAKQARINGFLTWVKSRTSPTSRILNWIQLGKTKCMYKLKIGKTDWQTLILPSLLFEGEQEVYLGRGVSAKPVLVEGRRALIGMKSLTEGWRAASPWILLEEENTDSNQG